MPPIPPAAVSPYAYGTGCEQHERAAVSAIDPLVAEAAAAAFLAVSPKTLRKWRIYGCGPAYCKIGRRVVRYRRSDLEAFVHTRMRTSTSATAAA
jgi:hypothetical protein